MMVLKLKDPLEGRLKPVLLDPSPAFFIPELSVGLTVCIANTFPDISNAAGPGTAVSQSLSPARGSKILKRAASFLSMRHCPS